MKLWIHHDMAAYVSPSMQFLRKWPIGNRFTRGADWMIKTVESLLAENVALSLSWSNRTGAMLRVLFQTMPGSQDSLAPGSAITSTTGTRDREP